MVQSIVAFFFAPECRRSLSCGIFDHKPLHEEYFNEACCEGCFEEGFDFSVSGVFRGVKGSGDCGGYHSDSLDSPCRRISLNRIRRYMVCPELLHGF